MALSDEARRRLDELMAQLPGMLAHSTGRAATPEEIDASVLEWIDWANQLLLGLAERVDAISWALIQGGVDLGPFIEAVEAKRPKPGE